MFLPMQNKPQSSADYEEAIIEVPNVIDKELAEQLKNFSLDAEVSGRHRRGSKTPNVVQASFYTCLVFQHNSPVYKILDPIWEQYCSPHKPNITFFIETLLMSIIYINDKEKNLIMSYAC